MASSASTLRWMHLGRVGYRPAWALQRLLWSEIVNGADEVVLTLEHEPVLTLGRRGKHEDLLLPPDELAARGIEIVESDRGGEVTWHGPGQLVVYLLANTRTRNIGPSDLVRKLTEAMRRTADDHGVSPHWDDEHPGLWVNNAKIGSVGMRISRGVSLHGASLNIAPDLTVFSLFVPCGMRGSAVTSLALQAQDPTLRENWEAIASRAAQHVADMLEATLVPTDAPPQPWIDPTAGEQPLHADAQADSDAQAGGDGSVAAEDPAE